jgi:hypothetical protein
MRAAPRSEKPRRSGANGRVGDPGLEPGTSSLSAPEGRHGDGPKRLGWRGRGRSRRGGSPATAVAASGAFPDRSRRSTRGAQPPLTCTWSEARARQSRRGRRTERSSRRSGRLDGRDRRSYPPWRLCSHEQMHRRDAGMRGLQNRQADVARRLVGSIPAPLRSGGLALQRRLRRLRRTGCQRPRGSAEVSRYVVYADVRSLAVPSGGAVDPPSAGSGLPSYPADQRSRRGSIKGSPKGRAQRAATAVSLDGFARRS